MYMADWIKQLDNFLTMTGKEILNHAGQITNQQALEKAHTEYEKYKKSIKNIISNVEKDFLKQIESKFKKIEK